MVSKPIFFFKQKTAYEITVRDWSSDVCSSDLRHQALPRPPQRQPKTIRLDRIGSLDPGQARQTDRTVRMSQSTSSVALSRLSARSLGFEPRKPGEVERQVGQSDLHPSPRQPDGADEQRHPMLLPGKH